MRCLPALPGLVGAAMAVALGVSLLRAGCAPTGIHTAEDAKSWERPFFHFQR